MVTIGAVCGGWMGKGGGRKRGKGVNSPKRWIIFLLTCSFLQLFPPFPSGCQPLALQQWGECSHLLQTWGTGWGVFLFPTSPRLRPCLQLHRHRTELERGPHKNNLRTLKTPNSPQFFFFYLHTFRSSPSSSCSWLSSMVSSSSSSGIHGDISIPVTTSGTAATGPGQHSGDEWGPNFGG